jgi:hypothetical protein
VLFLADLILDVFEPLVDELYDVSAFEADQVVVMRTSEGFFIP